ncbi:bifunctional diguanylate cyclase/phosphodiesterase [Amnibacterium sp. CER49]|uniref:putative bifunctional diguanylate cyclase/phosphodiesterase n=1 Tax=Amnibacterium sp. CER49 TaxID=3039161 RepID=UPI00244A8122|nr:bifunctional diguanylate cyclase/phosphodiesterase [Amnibacterium sp. CER49]MDH2443522.1 bifunctional diguanylate cyclase/phosphodiesterase [Amnibacterium sp. CER49]
MAQGEAQAALREVEAQRDATTSLLAVAERLGRATDGPDLATTMARAIQDMVGSDRAAVAIWDEEADRLRIAAVSGMPEHLIEAALNYELAPADSAELTEQLRKPRVRLTTPESSEWAAGALAAFENKAFVSMPVLIAGAVRGVLLAYWSESPAPEAVTPELEQQLAGLAGLMTVALEAVRLLERARRSAEVDGLTGLLSRAALERALATALVERGPGEDVAVLFADVDRFKRINDALGHVAGDEVLRAVATVLRSAVRPRDLVARVGGDELVVLLPHLSDLGQAEQVRDRIHELLNAPLVVAEQPVFVRLSIGMASSANVDMTRDPSAVAIELLRRADTAMYEIKRHRGPLPVPGRGIDLLRLDTELHGAVQRGEIETYFQPIVEAGTRRVVAHEALVRWAHPRYGLLRPDQFLPLAEENGTIDAIERAVIADACAFCARAHTLAPGISINVSRRHLMRDDFTRHLIDAVQRQAVAAGHLTVEVTESHLVTDLPLLRRELDLIRAAGIGVAIDDFGTGYSSLSQLQDLPVSQLKIDRTFVHHGGEVGRSLIRVIVDLARNLGLQVVAEGVQTVEQAAMLEGAGCDRLQGYLFGAPMPATQTLSRLGL